MGAPSTPAPELQRQPRTLWAWAAATFFGIGMVGKGGGTVAAVATTLLWWLIAVRGSTFHSRILWTIVAAVAATLIGIFAGNIVARELGKKDPSEVVIDEVAGQLIALIAAPLDWKYVLASLILFRVFDIFKPPPVRQLERLPNGVGIMMDDVAAGFYAVLLLHLMYYFRLLG